MDNITMSQLLNITTANTSAENSTDSAQHQSAANSEAMHPELAMAILFWQYFPPVLIVIGTLGNIMSVVVLCRKNMWKMASSPYLVVLAVADISVLYTGLLRQWIRYLWEVDIRELSPIACKIHTFLVYTSVDFSVWILVAVSVERFICVCFPFKAKYICNRTRAKITMLVILLVLLALNCHFVYGFGSVYDHSNGEPELLTHCGSLYDHYLYFYNNTWPWIDLSVFSLIPFVIIIICNISLIGRVVLCRRMNKVQPSDTGNGQRVKPSSMTLLLLSLNTTFLISTAPISIYLIGYPQWITTATYDEAVRLYLWWAVVNFLMYLNNTVNFIFYCVSGRRFRSELREMCGRNNRVGVHFTATVSDVPQVSNIPSQTNVTQLQVTPM